MRKISAVAAVGLTFAAAVTGVAWYTGTQIEARVTRSIDGANTRAHQTGQELGVPLSIQSVSFERGVFSSRHRYRIAATFPEGDEMAGTHEIEIVEAIDHGPFPLSELAAGRLAPAMAAGRAALIQTPFVDAWFAATGGVAPVSATYRISYAGDVSGSIEAAPMKLADDDSTIALSGIRADVSYIEHTRQRTMSLALDDWAFTDHAGSPVKSLRARGVQMAFDLTPTVSGIHVGVFTLKIGHWGAHLDGRLHDIRDMALTVASDVNASRMDAKVDMVVGKVMVEDNDWGGWKLAAGLQNIDAKALAAMTELYNTAVHREQEIVPTLTPAESGALATLIAELVAGRPKLTLAPLEVRTANATASLRLDARLAVPDSSAQPLHYQHILESFDIAVEVPALSVADFLVLERLQEGMPMEEIKDQMASIREQADNIIALLTATGRGRIENGNFVSRAKLVAGKLMFNGEKMSFDQLLMRVIAGT